MRQLKETYTKNGYTHKVLWRDTDYAISQVSDSDTGRIYCYEAFMIIKNAARSTKLMTTDAFESTPSNEQWGQKGLTAHSYEKAEQHINKLKSMREKWTKNKNN